MALARGLCDLVGEHTEHPVGIELAGREVRLRGGRHDQPFPRRPGSAIRSADGRRLPIGSISN
jgi:hypothetical protein